MSAVDNKLTTPPRKTALEPATEVMALPTPPPVQDSAVAQVRPFDSRAATRAAARRDVVDSMGGILP